MSMTRGLRRVWVVLSIVYILAASTAAVMHFYYLKRVEAQIVEDVAEQERAPKNDAHFGGPRFSPERRLAEIQEERRLAMIISPFAIFVPPIAVYCIVGALIWAADGFKADPPGESNGMK
jgi:hypothetical protein